MITKLEIELKSENKLNQHTGSLMHGILMELLDTEVAEELHNNSIQPFSQYIIYDKTKDCYVWHISTLSSISKEKIILPVINSDLKHLTIEHNKIKLEVKNKVLKPDLLYEEIADECFSQNEVSNIYNMQFLTPTTFKSNNNYTIFPEITYLYKSLLNKWNAFSEKVSLSDAQTLEHLINYTKIIDYNLKSTRFHMEKIKINSFLGTVKLKINGPKTLVTLVKMLLIYAQYAGIGAKTALGMGGTILE